MATKYLDANGMQVIVNKTKDGLDDKVSLAGATMTGELKTPSAKLGTNYKNTAGNVFEIGNGADASNLNNAFSVDGSGNIIASGEIQDGSGETMDTINTRLGSGYVAKGSVLFSALPTPSAANVGFVYDVYAMSADATPVEIDFTIDNRFVDYEDGKTKKYPSHSNVAVIEAVPAEGATPAVYKFDVIPGFIDQNIVNDYMEGLTSDDIDDMWSDTP